MNALGAESPSVAARRGSSYVRLRPGEILDVERGGWVYKDPTVGMELQVVGLRMGILGGSGTLVFNRFTGPGRIGVQSMYLHLPTEE